MLSQPSTPIQEYFRLVQALILSFMNEGRWKVSPEHLKHEIHPKNSLFFEKKCQFQPHSKKFIIANSILLAYSLKHIDR